jgi:hypothetical protein
MWFRASSPHLYTPGGANATLLTPAIMKPPTDTGSTALSEQPSTDPSAVIPHRQRVATPDVGEAKERF